MSSHLIDDFLKLYDKMLPKTVYNSWSVNEKNNSASLTELIIVAEKATFKGFDQNLTKDMFCITEKRSSFLQNFECDGFAFFLRDDEKRLIFVELKSTYDTKDIRKAFSQLTASLFKMIMMLSLCSDFSLTIPIHFIIACQCFKDEMQKAKVLEFMDKQEQLSKKNILIRLLNDIVIKSKTESTIMAKLSDFSFKADEAFKIEKAPIASKIKEINLHLTLKMTERFGNSSAKLLLP